MKKISLYLYKKACILGLPLFRGRRVEADLARLYPGERVEYVKTQYYVKKLSLTLTVLLVGLLLGLMVRWNAVRSAILEEEGAVLRGDLEAEQLWLEADDGESRRTFLVEVSPREPTEQEAAALLESFLQNITVRVLNGNEDFAHITGDLALQETYEGYPLEVIWESSREDIIDGRGRVGSVEAPVALELRVRASCKDLERTEVISVTVRPKESSEEEKDYLELKELLLETERENREKEVWKLPAQWKGKGLEWSLRKKDHSLLIWAAAPLVALLLYLSADRDLHGELEKKRKRLEREYPELAYRLLLYVGAGMTVRRAFLKIGGDYEKKRQQGAVEKPGCAQVLYTCRELQGGVSEGAAYEHFGRRTGSRDYIRLGTVLCQNLRRGNGALLERLREEVDRSSGENLQRVKKLGEEAGTKLLAPMALMLAVVMIVIMVPAFGTLG